MTPAASAVPGAALGFEAPTPHTNTSPRLLLGPHHYPCWGGVRGHHRRGFGIGSIARLMHWEPLNAGGGGKIINHGFQGSAVLFAAQLFI